MSLQPGRRIHWDRFGASGGEKTAVPDRPGLRSVAWWAATFCAVSVLFHRFLVVPVPYGIMLYGVVVGCINALVAVGLILVYRSNRIINFAAAEIGVLGAIVFEKLYRNYNVPWAFAFVAGVLASTLLAGAFERVLIRRFESSPRLILTVATLGLAELAVGASAGASAVLSPKGKKLPLTAGIVTWLSHYHLRIAGERFDGNALLLAGVMPLVVFGLGLFLRRSDVGVAMRASAESQERARLLGVPVARLSTIAWLVAGALAGLGAVLRSPVVGTVAGGSLQGPGLLLRALAACVIAGFEDVGTAVLAALVLGAVEQGLVYAYSGSTVVDVVYVIVIIAALLIRKVGTDRMAGMGATGLAAIEEVRGIPARLVRLPEVRIARIALATVLALFLLTYPLYSTESHINLASVTAIYALVAVSLVVLTGWSGQLSFGQFGLVGFGAAVGARMVADARVDFFLAVLIAGLASGLIAVVLGLAALRLKGFYFAVTSLAFAVSVETFFLNHQFFAALLPNSRPERPVLFKRIDLSGETAFYYFALIVLVLFIFFAKGMRRSRTGRMLVAIRDNERGAAAYGISPAKAKLTAFMVSGFIAGVAGTLFAVQQHAVVAGAFAPDQSLSVFSMVVIGGLGSLGGAVVGALFIRGAQFVLPANLAVVTTGVGLLVVLLVLPGGLARIGISARDRFLRKVAERRGIIVPSLVADKRDASAVASDKVPAVGPLEVIDMTAAAAILEEVTG